MAQREYEKRERLLPPGEVAALFGVDAKTVSRWKLAGRLPGVRTPGGHNRFREYDVAALLAGRELPDRDEWGRVFVKPTPAPDPGSVAESSPTPDQEA